MEKRRALARTRATHPFDLFVEGPPAPGLGPTLEKMGRVSAGVGAPQSSPDNIAEESSRLLRLP